MAARSTIVFRNPTVPNLRPNASIFTSGLGAVNEGLRAFERIGADIEQTNQQQVQNRADLDLSNLRAAAEEQLGGQQAGETLADYNASIDLFLERNTNLTDDLGQRGINDFRTNFKAKITGQRDTQEQRDITLDQRARTKTLNKRADDEFARKTAIREQNLGAREFAAGHQQRRADARTKFNTDPGSLTDEELDLLDTTGSVNQLENQLNTQFSGADPGVLRGFVGDATTTAQRSVLTSVEAAKLATTKRNEQRQYDASVAEQAVQRKFDQKEFDSLAKQDYKYAAGDFLSAQGDLIEALTTKNGGDAPSDDILEALTPLIQQYTAQGYHAQDVVNALVLKTEAKDEILTFDFDESLNDPEEIPGLIQLSAQSQLFNQRQKRLARIGANRAGAETRAPAPAEAAPVVDASPQLPAAITGPVTDGQLVPDATAQSVAALQQAAGAPVAPPPPAPTQVEPNLPEDVTLPAVGATTPEEIPALKIEAEAEVSTLAAELPDLKGDARKKLLADISSIRKYIGRLEDREEDFVEAALNLDNIDVRGRAGASGQ